MPQKGTHTGQLVAIALQVEHRMTLFRFRLEDFDTIRSVAATAKFGLIYDLFLVTQFTTMIAWGRVGRSGGKMRRNSFKLPFRVVR